MRNPVEVPTGYGTWTASKGSLDLCCGSRNLRYEGCTIHGMKIVTQEEWPGVLDLLNPEDLRHEGLVLLWDKPVAWSSNDVVTVIRGILRKHGFGKVKVGHAGTLDPLATGLLMVLIGKATRQQDAFMKLDKEYVVEGVLGVVSDTFDVAGEIEISISKHEILNSKQITNNKLQFPNQEIVGELRVSLGKVLPKFVGKIRQQVPAFSAVKIGGKKLYSQARSGQIGDDILPTREVEIHELELVDVGYTMLELDRKIEDEDQKFHYGRFGLDDNAPAQQELKEMKLAYFRLRVRCSSGTYIRSLVHDIGQELGCGAVVKELRRTRVGEFLL